MLANRPNEFCDKGIQLEQVEESEFLFIAHLPQKFVFFCGTRRTTCSHAHDAGDYRKSRRTSAEVSWASVPGATYYRVYRQWYRYSSGVGSNGWKSFVVSSNTFVDPNLLADVYTGASTPTFSMGGYAKSQVRPMSATEPEATHYRRVHTAMMPHSDSTSACTVAMAIRAEFAMNSAPYSMLGSGRSRRSTGALLTD